jgi:hypothetical protein
MEAIELARKAQMQAPLGTARVRLFCIEARAWSHVGDRDQMNRAVLAAMDAREQGEGTDDLHDRIGGEFGFDSARQFFCTGTAYLQVDAPEEAIRQTQFAIDLYRKTPDERRSPVFESQAHTDLATAYLMRSDFDGARAALRPVFMLAPAYRIGGLVHRLDRVRQMLIRGPHGQLPEARKLGEEIGSFTADTVTAGLRLGRN